MRERLQKILAGAGGTSRRKAEDWLRAGRVTVNGAVARLGDSADPEADAIRLDGRPVTPAPASYWLFHKPRGVLSTTRDPKARPLGRRTVVECLPPDARARERGLFPVGRLDLDSEGLLLLTNDGDVAHALLHPSLGTEREYRVTARGRLPKASAARLERGLRLDDGPMAPCRVSGLRFDARAGTTRLTLTLREGRKRQIRRALRALGHPVLRLRRVRMGPLRLGRLAPGAARPLEARERTALLRDAKRRLAGRQDAPQSPAGRRKRRRRRAGNASASSRRGGPRN